MVVRKNDDGWDMNKCPQQPETYTGFEVAAVLQRSTDVRPGFRNLWLAKEFHAVRNLLYPLKFGRPDFMWLLDFANLKSPQIMAQTFFIFLIDIHQ